MPDQPELHTDPWDDKARKAIHDALMNRRIGIVNSYGQPNPQLITSDSTYRDEHPLWSADGAHILFGRMTSVPAKGEGVDNFATASLWLMESDGKNPRIRADDLSPGWREGGISWYSDRTARRMGTVPRLVDRAFLTHP